MSTRAVNSGCTDAIVPLPHTTSHTSHPWVTEYRHGNFKLCSFYPGTHAPKLPPILDEKGGLSWRNLRWQLKHIGGHVDNHTSFLRRTRRPGSDPLTDPPTESFRVSRRGRGTVPIVKPIPLPAAVVSQYGCGHHNNPHVILGRTSQTEPSESFNPSA